MMQHRICFLSAILLLAACGKSTAPAQDENVHRFPLADARRGFTTKLITKEHVGEPVPTPPAGVFDLVKYPASTGELPAYVSHPPTDGKKHPAILWIVGGFSNSISEIAWTPGPADNDQSASSFREAGVLMMYPSLRGGNDNPGFIENFYGEVDDVLAARNWLAKQPNVDPERIYLGGHSTGGTLALLVAESSSGFRAVFAFGPAANVRSYGTDNLFYDLSNPKESELRSPARWLAGISRPTFVFEGTKPPSNIASLNALAKASQNAAIGFHSLPNATHFSGLRPVSQLIAQKILHDTGPTSNVAFTEQEIAAALGSSHRP